MKKIKFKIDSIILKTLIYFTFNKEKLKDIQNQLNSWNYPECFIFFKPKYFDNTKCYFIQDNKSHILYKNNGGLFKFDFINPSRKLLQKRITHKEFLQYHWIKNLNRTNEEFEKWYKIEFGNDSKY